MIKSAQRKMLRLIVQTRRRCKEKTKKRKNDEGPEKDEEKTKESEEKCVTDEETEGGSKPNSDCNQDSDVSFHEDKDEVIDKGEIEEEDWTEYIKRSTKEAEEQMTMTKILCLIELTER